MYPESRCVHLRNAREAHKLCRGDPIYDTIAPTAWRSRRSQGHRMFKCLYTTIFLSEMHSRFGNASSLLDASRTHPSDLSRCANWSHVDRGEHTHPRARLSHCLIRAVLLFVEKSDKLAVVMQEGAVLLVRFKCGERNMDQCRFNSS